MQEATAQMMTNAAWMPKNAMAATVAGMSATSTSRMMMCVVTALEICGAGRRTKGLWAGLSRLTGSSCFLKSAMLSPPLRLALLGTQHRAREMGGLNERLLGGAHVRAGAALHAEVGHELVEALHVAGEVGLVDVDG